MLLVCAACAPGARQGRIGPGADVVVEWRGFVGCYAVGPLQLALDSVEAPRVRTMYGLADARRVRWLPEIPPRTEVERELTVRYWRLVGDSVEVVMSNGFTGSVTRFPIGGHRGRTEWFSDVVTGEPNPSGPVQVWPLPCAPPADSAAAPASTSTPP